MPDLNGFIRGMKILLHENGIITLEFPHLMRLMEENQFDTIYHEHLSYFSLITIRELFRRHGLKVFDVEELTTHGGSLRIYACHEDDNFKPVGEAREDLLSREEKAGFTKLEHYLAFGEQVKETKRKFLEFLMTAKVDKKSIVGYGAPAKGNTLLNYCGVWYESNRLHRRSQPPQTRTFPSRALVFRSTLRTRISETMPDYLLILPWNLKDEIMQQMSYIRDWNGRFVVPDTGSSDPLAIVCLFCRRCFSKKQNWEGPTSLSWSQPQTKEVILPGPTVVKNLRGTVLTRAWRSAIFLITGRKARLGECTIRSRPCARQN